MLTAPTRKRSLSSGGDHTSLGDVQSYGAVKATAGAISILEPMKKTGGQSTGRFGTRIFHRGMVMSKNLSVSTVLSKTCRNSQTVIFCRQWNLTALKKMYRPAFAKNTKGSAT